MANSINVTQNKWSCITQLKGASGCLCRSLLLLQPLLCLLCLVSGKRPQSLADPSVAASTLSPWVGSICPELLLQGQMGKANRELYVAQVVNLALFLVSLLILYASSSVTDPYCRAKDSLLSLLPGELLKRALPLSMGFLSTQSSWENLAGSCSWQPLPGYSRPLSLREGRFWV